MPISKAKRLRATGATTAVAVAAVARAPVEIEVRAAPGRAVPEVQVAATSVVRGAMGPAAAREARVRVEIVPVAIARRTVEAATIAALAAMTVARATINAPLHPRRSSRSRSRLSSSPSPACSRRLRRR